MINKTRNKEMKKITRWMLDTIEFVDIVNEEVRLKVYHRFVQSQSLKIRFPYISLSSY